LCTNNDNQSSNSPCPLDVEINDLDSVGLTSASKVRMKLFTLDERLIIRRAGSLAEQDKKLIKKAIQQLMNVY
jgi:mRNA interferase MazF